MLVRDLTSIIHIVDVLYYSTIHVQFFRSLGIKISKPNKMNTRSPKGHISCTWVPCATFRRIGQGDRLVSDQPEKHKLGRGRWDLASCQVSLNPLQLLQRRNRKSISQSEAGATILFFRSARKTQTLGTLRSCFLLSFGKFHSRVLEEKSKMPQPIRSQAAMFFFV